MDEETKAASEGVLAAIRGIEAATKVQLDAMLARVNDGFERVLEKQHVLQVADDNPTQRVTRLEQDVRQLRGGI
jgi:hypothetical protein